MKKIIVQMCLNKFLGPKKFCEPDSETLTSTSQEPVGLSFNSRASRVWGWSPMWGDEGGEASLETGDREGRNPLTIFFMRFSYFTGVHQSF